MDSEDFHFKFKICVLGDKHAGKSTLIDGIAVNFGKILEDEVSEE
jgi:translation elongation factor EF-1alpha